MRRNDSLHTLCLSNHSCLWLGHAFQAREPHLSTPLHSTHSSKRLHSPHAILEYSLGVTHWGPQSQVVQSCSPKAPLDFPFVHTRRCLCATVLASLIFPSSHIILLILYQFPPFVVVCTLFSLMIPKGTCCSYPCISFDQLHVISLCNADPLHKDPLQALLSY